MLGPDDMVLCSGTVPQASLAERIEVAAKTGFRGISLFYSDYQRARDAGLSDADIRRLLDDHGVEFAELDPLMDWIPGGAVPKPAADQPGAEYFGTGEDQFYTLAQSFGARSINAIVVSPVAPEPAVLADAFGALCDRAAKHALKVHLEFLPWTAVPDLPSAFEIVDLADRPNGGIMFDSWHHFRSGVDNAVLSSVPGGRILAIQLNDAPAEAEANLIEETLHRRLLPGEGDMDLVDMVGRLLEIGAQAPIGVEIFSSELAKLSPLEAAQRAADATRAIVEKARARR